MRDLQGTALSIGGTTAVLLTLCIGAISAQTDRRAEVDRLFAEWARPGSPGCALAILRDGAVIHTRGYGSANLDYDIPITSGTVFYMASVSKQFAAASVALAAKQGRLSLDDDIREYMPEIPDYGHRITVRHLVHHTSGIRDYLYLLSLAGRLPDFHTNQDIVDLIARQRELNFTPGTEWSYSNSGYFLLSMIMERGTGQSMREYAEANVFGPLGMTNTHFHDDVVRDHVVKNRAIGYVPGDDGFTIAYMTNFDKVGDGGLYSTVDDMIRWDANFDSPVVGDRGFIEELQVPGRLADGAPLQTASGDTVRYAFALQRGQYRGLATVGHSGGFMGYRTEYRRFPHQRFSVICLCNLGTINPGQLAERIADIYLADQFTAPAPPEPDNPNPGANDSTYAISPRTLSDYTGRYFSAELMTTYELRLQGADLMASWHATTERPLQPTGPDTFRLRAPLGSAQVEFQRDAQARVVGFRLSAVPAKNIAFVKR